MYPSTFEIRHWRTQICHDLKDAGWSNREISLLTGWNLTTIGNYLGGPRPTTEIKPKPIRDIGKNTVPCASCVRLGVVDPITVHKNTGPCRKCMQPVCRPCRVPVSVKKIKQKDVWICKACEGGTLVSMPTLPMRGQY